MAELLTSTEQIVRLSSIDQSISRGYIRLALCYKDNDTTLGEIAKRLTPAVKNAITHLPILAGFVRTVTDGSSSQRGRLEVVTTVDRVNTFKPTMKSVIGLDFKTYEQLSGASMPPSELVKAMLAPLPDNPEQSENPVFAMQANVISGGLIVAVYLHHAVGDLATLKMIIQIISSGLPHSNLTPKDLKDKTEEQSRLRDRLTGSRGYTSQLAQLVRFATIQITVARQIMTQIDINAPGNTACLFSFKLDLLDRVKSFVDNRARDIHNRPPLHVSSFAILGAILWKGITRARLIREYVDVDEFEAMAQTSTFFTPVNLRKRIDDSIDGTYFGNAFLEAFATQQIRKLSMGLDAAGIEQAARAIMTATSSVSEARVRSAIASINEAEDVSKVEMKGMVLSSDLAVLSWADLCLQESTLGLGLGQPDWARQMSTSVDSFVGCLVHTRREDEGVWDVMMQFPLQTMQRLREDAGFMEFVKNYS